MYNTVHAASWEQMCPKAFEGFDQKMPLEQQKHAPDKRNSVNSFCPKADFTSKHTSKHTNQHFLGGKMSGKPAAITNKTSKQTQEKPMAFNQGEAWFNCLGQLPASLESRLAPWPSSSHPTDKDPAMEAATEKTRKPRTSNRGLPCHMKERQKARKKLSCNGGSTRETRKGRNKQQDKYLLAATEEAAQTAGTQEQATDKYLP